MTHINGAKKSQSDKQQLLIIWRDEAFNLILKWSDLYTTTVVSDDWHINFFKN